MKRFLLDTQILVWFLNEDKKLNKNISEDISFFQNNYFVSIETLHEIITLQLFIKSKIQFFESKSQQKTNKQRNGNSCLSSQRYNFLKANHNSSCLSASFCNVVYQVKDTIFWKQITTIHNNEKTKNLLFIKSKIQFFESNHNRQRQLIVLA